MRARFMFFLVALFWGVHTQAKCPNVFIYVEGQIEGDFTSAHKIEILVEPDPNQPVSPIAVEGVKFKSRIAFDTFKSYGVFRGHNCSRKPKSVELLVKKGETQVLKQKLYVSKDFVRTPSGHYEAKERLILRMPD